MLIETCYKALYNAMTRAIQDKEVNKRLIEKSMRLQFMVDAMKERGDSEDVINEVCFKNSITWQCLINFHFNRSTKRLHRLKKKL